MKLPIYVVSSFAETTFEGNPAAVVVSEQPLSREVMQSIAAQNNLSETAFVVLGEEPQLSWFSPAVEVDLCGHATLAAAYVLWNHGYREDPELRFSTLSGTVSVRQQGDRLQLNFPARPSQPVNIDKQLVAEALGCKVHAVEEIRESRSLVVVLSNEELLRQLAPDLQKVGHLHPWALMITAAGTEVDLVARFFAPNSGINEDPVTGSAYTTLAPYWAERLSKTQLTARQLSRRGGQLWCEVRGERVLISGKVQPYLVGEIELLSLTGTHVIGGVLPK